MKRRSNYQSRVSKDSQFELDLAPLLSVMVKLVPVLLLSSAFFQVSIIETDLPQAVQAAIIENQKNPNLPEVELYIDYQDGFQIQVLNNGQAEKVTVPLSAEKKLDFLALNSELSKIKELYPQVFEINLHPSSEVSYQDIIYSIDMARKSKDLKFIFNEPTTDEQKETTFMFPEVTFANILEG